MNAEIALPRGYSLQEYRIESTLGIGGFGLTYLATDSNLNVKVAIKEYLPGDLALRKAVRTAYRLDHLPSQQEELCLHYMLGPMQRMYT